MGVKKIRFKARLNRSVEKWVQPFKWFLFFLCNYVASQICYARTNESLYPTLDIICFLWLIISVVFGFVFFIGFLVYTEDWSKEYRTQFTWHWIYVKRNGLRYEIHLHTLYHKEILKTYEFKYGDEANKQEILEDAYLYIEEYIYRHTDEENH